VKSAPTFMGGTSLRSTTLKARAAAAGDIPENYPRAAVGSDLSPSAARTRAAGDAVVSEAWPFARRAIASSREPPEADPAELGTSPLMQPLVLLPACRSLTAQACLVWGHECLLTTVNNGGAVGF